MLQKDTFSAIFTIKNYKKMKNKNIDHNNEYGLNDKRLHKHYQHKRKKLRRKLILRLLRNILIIFLSLFFIGLTVVSIYISTITVPDFSNFANRKIDNSTQIYDRTGKILLYDVHGDIKRVQVSSDAISKYVKDATVAVEDKYFYEHHGIRPTSILRAITANIKAGSFVQGGSTIDQQIIKNALLSQKKSILRKVTEWAMAVKLDSQVSKDDILTIYLNDAAYGGTIYGIQTASRYFFGKDAKDLSLAESAYLAAIPNAPSYYSPYGNHIDELEARKNLILKLMLKQEKISGAEYDQAINEKVVWEKNIETGKAMHFVFFVRDYLEKKYGKDVVDKGGLKVITTLNYDYQTEAEKIVNEHALENAKKFQATNAGLVAIDPKTGQILTMVGSRDYFDTEIPGNFNVTTALRQPGSSFKPIVYATAFMDGYNPNTVLYDLQTEFNVNCSPSVSLNLDNPVCYHPNNYDGQFRGPVSIRNALAQSLNIPAVKTLYLVGVKNAISTAQKMGITSLDPNGDYGLSLVLGSGEVSLLQLTNAYAVFANEGIYNPPAMILSVEDKDGAILEQYTQNNIYSIPEYTADQINSILSDNTARTPLYGPNSELYFPGRDVAAKTGTTNKYRDTWTIGYTPDIVVGVWAGNNDNTPINKGMSGTVAVPMWSTFMKNVLNELPNTKFKPISNGSEIKPDFYSPVIDGEYCYTDNGTNYSYSILSEKDSQYYLWRSPENSWAMSNYCPFSGNNGEVSTENSSTTDPINSIDQQNGTNINIGLPTVIPTTTIQQ